MRVRCFLYSLVYLIFVLKNCKINAHENIEKNVIVGTNITLLCNSTKEHIWWTKDNKNLTKTDTRIIISSVPSTTSSQNDNSLDEETKTDYVLKKIHHSLSIFVITFNDTGNYTCQYKMNTDKTKDITGKPIVSFYLQPIITPKIKAQNRDISVKLKDEKIPKVVLFCLIEAYPLEYFRNSAKWYKEDARDTDSTSSQQNSPELITQIVENTKVVELNGTHINVTLTFDEITKKHNGTYICNVSPSSFHEDATETVEAKTSIIVLDAPVALIDYIKGVGQRSIFMNWTINDGNDPIFDLYIQFRKSTEEGWTYYSEKIGIGNQSYVLDKLEPKTSYKFRLAARNSQNTGPFDESNWVETLDADPNFIPQIAVKGSTHSTITIGWAPPPLELLEYVQFYELKVEHSYNSSDFEEAIHPQNSRNLPYMFDNLKIATEYNFKVRACSELTKRCGDWSAVVNGTTMDYLSSEPNNLRIVCSHSNVSRRNTVIVDWEKPTVPNGQIISYQIVLTGIATFKANGKFKNETYGPKSSNVDLKSLKTTYDSVPPNTNYTVTVAAVTRSKKPGIQAKAVCEMPTTVPDSVGHWSWGKIRTETNDWVFKLFSHRISERNGPICCYRIYLVRISDKVQYGDLPSSPENLDIMSYYEVHAKNNTMGGAYLAEIVTSDMFNSEIFLGDGKQIVHNNHFDDGCRVCMENVAKIKRKSSLLTSLTSTPPSLSNPDAVDKLSNIDTDYDSVDDLSRLAVNKTRRRRRRRRRQHEDSVNPGEISRLNDFTTNSNDIVGISNDLAPIYFDGQLDMGSRYTGFVEIIVRNNNGNKGGVLSTFTEYFDEMAPGAPLELDSEEDELSVILRIAIMVLIALILFGILLLTTLCLVHRHYSRNIGQGDEVISLRDSLSRAFCHGRSSNNQHRHLITTANLAKPPDLPPISRGDLPQAYKDRHKDSDYGFQHEFELLPDRFNDRTTKSSDNKDNIYKNRYPDIKAYDQTRVKLQQVNSIMGSDYINANVVIGYKERKKFICAQGPMDGTINDFWRMIWEQHLEIIVMLTNLEEYNKTKCAKYWPEKIGDSTQFGDINVYYQHETRFSDYLVRHMKITRRSHDDDNEDQSRTITQYHYLVWKDFMAPEHPHGIIKFIKQINSVYSVQRGAILVHCSAGVGRTGTLVALDTLSQQLDEEGHVSIFNTVCDMRHQRNFLVQSLKQYIFLYRALTDIAQFGDTELKYKGLSATIENLKQRANDSKEQCTLEIEFERIKSITDDIKKTCTVGNSEDNRCKNRSELVIPFDRNRVILTPIPGRDSSTYINASFIEGYDNQESFIIAQDPMENTIPDFWRMISEHNIKTIVMLSEINNDCKCPRYWADDEIQYDHILVKYIQSESCPYYTRREFTVTNCKINDLIYVTQFQYHGWPTVEGEVPEVTRGMLEIIQQSQNYHLHKKLKLDSNNDNVDYILPQNEISNSSNDISLHYNNDNDDDDNIMLEEDGGPIVVHCNLGTERSSIFVGMCILIQQLKLEKKIDVCTMVRKLRSQRNMLIDTYAQYEFLHRAIANYADLHRLSLDSPSDC